MLIFLTIALVNIKIIFNYDINEYKYSRLFKC